MIIKQFIIIIGIILAILSIYFGSILPLQKSRSFINSISQLGLAKNIGEVKKILGSALDFYSPVGQEEIVRFIGSQMAGIINPQQQEQVMRELVSYIEQYIFKNNSKHLLTMALSYERLFLSYKNPEDLEKTKNYYQKVLALSQKSPQALYGLFGIYQAQKDYDNAKKISEIILKYWPNDEKIKKIINESGN